MAKTEIDRRLAAIAVLQCGVFAAAQAIAEDASDEFMHWRVSSGQWTRVAPGVYLLPGVPESWMQRLWIAHLAAGPDSLVSHESAAAIDGVSGFPKRTVTLITPHGTHQRVRGVTVHQTRDPWPISSRLVDGLPVTTPARTLIDLASLRMARSRLKVAVDELVVGKKVTYADIRDELAAVARRGKRGVRLLASVLDEHDREPAKQSDLERAFFGLFDTFGGPRPEPQWPYPGRHQFNGCADAGFRDALLAVETDGRSWHTRVQDLKRDHERDAEAARNGVQVLRVLHEHVVGAPRETWQLIQDTRKTRLRQLGRHAA